MRAAVFFLWVVQGFAAFHLTWGIPAVSLDSNPSLGDSDVNPTVAIDPSGNAVAVWGRTSGQGATEDIWGSSYHHAARVWTGALLISGGGNASNPVVAMDENGNAVILWEEGFPTQIFSRTLSAEGVWTPPLDQAPISVSESPHAQTFPRLAVNERGEALAVWMELSGGIHRIRSAKKPMNSTWVDLGQLSDGLDAQLSPPIPFAINQKGEGLVVWQEPSDQIWGAFYTKGAWQSAFLAATGKQPSVAIDGSSKGVIVYNRDQVIQSKNYLNGLLSPESTLSNPAFPAQHPCVGIDERGTAIAVFERFDAPSLHKFVAGSTWDPTHNSWSAPVDISAPSPAAVSEAGYPILSINSIGDGVVIWKEYAEEKIVIQGAGYSLGTWSFIRTLSSLQGNSGLPAIGYDMGVSMNIAGNIMAVWPEDPTGQRTPHIKSVPGVGLAVAGPLPPVVDAKSILEGIGKGTQEVHRFPAHADYINILDWTSPGGVAYFKIYRGSLSSLIGTSSTPHYEDHQREPGKKETYLITSVDIHEHESGPMTIIVHPQ